MTSDIEVLAGDYRTGTVSNWMGVPIPYEIFRLAWKVRVERPKYLTEYAQAVLSGSLDRGTLGGWKSPPLPLIFPPSSETKTISASQCSSTAATSQPLTTQSLRPVKSLTQTPGRFGLPSFATLVRRPAHSLADLKWLLESDSSKR